MSDETQSPTPAEIEVLRSSYASMKLERDSAAKDRDAARSELGSLRTAAQAITTDRDTLAGKVTEFGQTRDTAQKERDEWKGKHETAAATVVELTNKTRERDVLDALAAAYPGADRSIVRGAFLVAVEAKQTERYPEDPAKAATALAELLKPTLSRALPVNGGPPQMPAPSSGPAKPGFYNIGARTPTATR